MNEESNLPRVAIDTNLVISGAISPKNIPSQVLTDWGQGNFQWIQTDETFYELKDVLNRENIKSKYHIEEAKIQTLLHNIAVGAEFVTPVPQESLPIHSRDENDDIILACALAGKCDYLITGDEDLLILNGRTEMGNLEIIKASKFLKRKRF